MNVYCLSLLVIVSLSFLCDATNYTSPTWKKTKYPLPPHIKKRSLVFDTQAGYIWTFSVGCSLIPSEVDRIVNAFFQSSEYSQTLLTASDILSDVNAIPCYVTEMTQNVARTYVTLQCISSSLINVTRLEIFLRSNDILPLECRTRITVARGENIHVKTITTQSTPSMDRWHLDRTDQRGLPLSHTFTYAYVGTGVTVCIVDTGVWCAHNEFGTRCSSGGNFVNDGSPDTDSNGHGTHVASTCCGVSYGFAKNSTIKSYRVLDSTGSGTFGFVMDALMAIEDEFVNSPKMMVVSMSLSGPIYTPVNEMVNILALDHGIPVIAAAGNSGGNTDCCSPGSASGATAIAASDSGDFMASWSNRGGNTKMAAPGVSITAALTGTSNGVIAKSGTSMSAPCVSGIHAVMFQYMNATGNSGDIPFGLDVTSAVLAMASQHRVNGLPLLFSSIGLTDVPQVPATPPQSPSTASALPKPLGGLPIQPLGSMRSSAKGLVMPVFVWFMSSPLLILFVTLHLL